MNRKKKAKAEAERLDILRDHRHAVMGDAKAWEQSVTERERRVREQRG